VFRTLHSYQGERTGFRTWLCRITRNLLIDDYRKSRRSPRTLSYDSADGQIQHLIHSVPCRGYGPEARYERHEQRAAVSRALRLLNPELREAVILRDVKGLTYREVSEQLMTPLGTAKSRVNRGRIELLRLLRQGTAFSRHFSPNASAMA
jgi:RNA polymerase sigma-70 factor (ECF subfamily)